MEKLKPVALVTGGNRGIGLEIVRQLAAKDFHVFLASRNRKAGEEAAREIEKTKNVTVVEIDVSDAESIKKAAAEVSKSVDHLDVLVNNAGILLSEEQSVLEVDTSALIESFRTNTVGPVLVTQAFYPLLGKSKSARVINVSSGAGQLNDMEGWAPAYSISKTALNAVTRQFAAALKKDGIAVNCICPGWVRTDMGGPNATRSVEQGADTVTWLATDAPQSLTGKFLRDRKEIEW